MMFITQSNIVDLPADVTMHVRSCELSIYLVEFRTGSDQLIYSEDGKSAKVFRNVLDVKAAFSETSIKEAYLIHDSAYDEMIGQPQRESNKMAIPLSMIMPY